MSKYARRMAVMTETAAVVKGLFGALSDPELISLGIGSAMTHAAGAALSGSVIASALEKFGEKAGEEKVLFIAAEQLSALNNTLKALNDGYIPLFLCVDEEGGPVSRMPDEITDLPAAFIFVGASTVLGGLGLI